MTRESIGANDALRAEEYGSDDGYDTMPTFNNPQGDEERRQEAEDLAVESALEELMSRLAVDGYVPAGVEARLCDLPTSLRIPLAMVAHLETKAYARAQYGHRAEGLEHFDNVFRGFVEHGPLRCVVVAIKDGCGLRPVSFFDYFRVYSHLDEEFATAAAEWESQRSDFQPGTYIVSKLIADPDRPRILAALPGIVLATVLQALADANNHGACVEAIAQPSTQRFVDHSLSRAIPGLEVPLNRKFEGAGDGGAPSKLLIWVPRSGFGDGEGA